MVYKLVGALVLIMGLFGAIVVTRYSRAADPVPFAQDLRKGFAEVSSDWDGFAAVWADSSEMTFRKWGKYVTAYYVTEAELDSVYRERADLYVTVADDPLLNGLCTGYAYSPSMGDNSEDHLAEMGPLVGKGLARYHIGVKPWAPPAAMYTKEVWEAFATYLEHNGMGEVWSVFVREDIPTSPEVCHLSASLYRATADRPNDMVGSVRLIQFVRSLDALGAEAVGLATR